MRLVLIDVAFVVVLGGVLGAVVYVLTNFDVLSAGPTQAELVNGYVTLDNLSLPVTSGGVLDHYVGIDIRIEINDVSRQAEIAAILPRIRDAILREAHRFAPRRADGVDSIDLVRFREYARVKANEAIV